MILKVYSVYDKAAKTYLQPFYSVGKGVAFRMFQDAVNKADTPFHAHPEDYSLYELGAFDDQVGTMLMHQEPERVITAMELVAVKDSPVRS